MVIAKCQQIQKQVEEMRDLLAGNLYSPQNPTGCLRGTLDDYPITFDCQIEMLMARFEQDRVFWHQQLIASENFSKPDFS